MKNILLLLSLFLFIHQPNFCQSNYGHIQIKSESGIKVFLDDNFIGTTNDEYKGLVISKVTSGSHSIRVVKDGFQSKEYSINVKRDEVSILNVEEFVPKMNISESGNSENTAVKLSTGNLVIHSLPVECRILIEQLNIDVNKSKDKWSATSIPVGTYQLKVTYQDKVLSKEIVISQVTEDLFIDFIEGKIIDLNYERAKEKARLEKELLIKLESETLIPLMIDWKNWAGDYDLELPYEIDRGFFDKEYRGIDTGNIWCIECEGKSYYRDYKLLSHHDLESTKVRFNKTYTIVVDLTRYGGPNYAWADEPDLEVERHIEIKTPRYDSTIYKFIFWIRKIDKNCNVVDYELEAVKY